MPDFAVEISKLLPVKDIYEDVLQPAARQVGQIGGDLMKTLHLVLAPIQLTAGLQDRYRAFIDRSVRKVPKERRIQPASQIAGPVLEGIRYEPEGTEIEEMFANLLANAMDEHNVGRAHPAYPNIIKQLSKDEAILLLKLLTEPYLKITESDLKHDVNSRGESIHMYVNERIIVESPIREILHVDKRLEFYMKHLNIL